MNTWLFRSKISVLVLISVFFIIRIDDARAIDVDCIVSPSEIVKVSFPVGGLVSEVLTDRGQVVSAGSVLARLDSSVERASVAIAEQRVGNMADITAAQSRLDAAEKSLGRAKELFEKTVIPQQKLDQAALEFEQASLDIRNRQEARVLDRLELERAKALLAQKTLTSPISGVVVDRLFSTGEYVEHQAVFAIAKTDPIQIDIVAPADQFGRVKEGNDIQVSLEYPVGMIAKATVKVVDPFVDAASGTFRVKALSPNPDGKLIAGFRCTADFAQP